MKRPIYNRLLQFQEENRYPFHMPGHKRRLKNELSENLFGWDITEIDDFDDLHSPDGIIAESMKELKKFYQTEKTWYLINGSSSGNMAAVGAACQRGDSILIGRNCHKSVYQAVELFGLDPEYVYPEYDSELGMYAAVTSQKIEEKIKENPNIKAIVITSPTYEGVVSDIAGISEICHRYGIILIVDEAHGAHFPFSEYFPESSIQKGADIVIQSLHKTMAVPNQGALLHLCSRRVKEERLKRYQSLFQTTSPSYVLMASMEYGIEHGRTNRKLWQEYEERLSFYREKWQGLSKLHLVTEQDFEKNKIYDYDKGKLVISTKKIKLSGNQLAEKLLRDYGLQMEMSEKKYLIAMTSYMDSQEGFERLDRALWEIEHDLEEEQDQITLVEPVECEKVFLPGEAREKERVWMNLKDCIGKIAGEYVYIYPPGIPVLVPGEKINVKTLEKIEEYLYNKMEVKGLFQQQLCTIK